MKSIEEVESLAEGDLLYDKIKRDKEGNPFVWKVVGQFLRSRRVQDHFIRQIELQSKEKKEDEEDENTPKGYYVLSNDNMEDLIKDERIAKLYHLLWNMEDGITPALLEKLRNITAEILNQPTLADRLKGLDLFD